MTGRPERRQRPVHHSQTAHPPTPDRAARVRGQPRRRVLLHPQPQRAALALRCSTRRPKRGVFSRSSSTRSGPGGARAPQSPLWSRYPFDDHPSAPLPCSRVASASSTPPRFTKALCHPGFNERDEGNAEHHLDAADHSSDGGCRDDVVVPYRRDRLHRPPYAVPREWNSCWSTIRITTAPMTARIRNTARDRKSRTAR